MRTLGALAIILVGINASFVASASAISERRPPQRQADTQHEVGRAERRPRQSPGSANVNVPPSPQQQSQPGQPATPEERSLALAQQNTDIARQNVRIAYALAFFTWLLVALGALQWWTMRDTLTTNKDIERAYLSIEALPFKQWKDWPSVKPVGRFRVTNRGRTPTTTTRFGLTVIIGPASALPETPPAENHHRATYLLPGGYFDISFPITGIQTDTWLSFRYCEDETVRFWIVACVDYIDKFGRQHRAGITQVIRRFDQAGFDVEPRNGFNYDRPLKRNESERQP